MRSTFTLAMTVASTNAWGTRYGFSLTDLENFTEGLLLGAIEAELSDVMSCVHDAENVVTDVETAYTDFKKETFSGVKDGIIEIGTVVKDLATGFHDCSGTVS